MTSDFGQGVSSAPSVLRGVHRFRTPVAILLGAGLVLATVVVRPNDVTGVYPRRFWASKIQWKECADVVVAGDSRVYRGLSPAEMSRHLDACRVFNYSFSSAGYSELYLEAVEKLLDRQARRRIVVLGISPYSLTPAAARRNGFKESIEAPPDLILSLNLDAFFRRVEPMPPEEFFRVFLPTRRGMHYYEEYLEDGWVAGSKVPENPSEALSLYSDIFKGNTVDAAMIDTVLRFVRKWRAEGIEVYAFRVPTCREMVALENRISGFDEPTLVADFAAAGGTWIPLDQEGYVTYDGSHLRRDAALKLSADVATFIREHSGPAVATTPAAARGP